MPAVEYSRGTADNIFMWFHIMAFLYGDLKVINVPMNVSFLMDRSNAMTGRQEDGIGNKSSMTSNLHLLVFSHNLSFWKSLQNYNYF